MWPEDECACDGCGGCGEGRKPAAGGALEGCALQATGVYGWLLEQAGVLIGKFEVALARLPVGAQEVFELCVLIGGDFAVDFGVDEGVEIHARPSD
jgi:hypothetical protein